MKKAFFLITALGLMTLLICVPLARAANIRIPADLPTIQEGIDAAIAGDIVLVEDGIYTGPGNVEIDFKGKAITVMSKSGARNCIIDCEGTGRGFYFQSGEGMDSVLNGFTIKGGEGFLSPGGGIYCDSSSPLIINCIISGNSASLGGGIYCISSSPVIVNCIISGNSASETGAGIYCDFSFPAITNCTISDNSALEGGGIYCYQSSPVITNCILWNNSPDEIYADGGNVLSTITYSDIKGGYAGEGNIDADPLFVDPFMGDYHLQDGSPCIDAGGIIDGLLSDMEGNPRPAGEGYDIGAYEARTDDEGFDIGSYDPQDPLGNIFPDFTASAALPDLIIYKLSAPASAYPGQSISVYDTTKNQGLAGASSTVTRFYLSTNTTYDSGDTYLGSRTIPYLAAGATSAGSTSVTIPAITGPGIYYIIAVADASKVVSESNESNNTKGVIIKILPDLIIYKLTTSTSSPRPGQTITVTDTTKNQGTYSAGASITKLYFSYNTTYESTDTYLGSRSIPSLARGATNTGSTSVTIPSTVGAGTYYIIAVADANKVVTEISETNNIKYKLIKIYPDLIISALTTSTSYPKPGQTITVTDKTKNNGGYTAGASTTRFYLSTNSTYDSSDTYLGSRSIPSLAAGGTSSGSTSVTIPSTTGTGTYYIIAVADAGKVVTESNENNNTKFKVIKIYPDLIIYKLTTSTSYPKPGQSITVYDTTKNNGGAAAGASTTKFYLSTNSTYDSSDTYLGYRSIPSLAAGGTSSGSTSVTIPAIIGDGIYYIIAVADANKVVTESNESNNTKYKVIKIYPDLIISALTTSTSYPKPGQTITVTDTTKNSGGATAGASTTRFYLSTNTTYDSADTYLGSRSIPSLAAGGTSSGSTSVTIPAATGAGTYYIIAVADAGKVVTESNETNNTKYKIIKIRPDLIISALTTSTSYPKPGQTITVTDTTKNNGGITAGASTTKFYLSTNSTYDASDTYLGSRSIPSLAAGATSSGSTSVTIPATTGAGTYYIIAVADANKVVTESNENNNTKSKIIRIRPDLIISALTASTSYPKPGQTITVNDTTKNQGGVTAGASTTKFYFSTNTTLDSADDYIGYRSIPSLAAGTSSSGTTSVSIPSGLAPGTYYIIAAADADKVVTESNESNNTKYKVLIVQ